MEKGNFIKLRECKNFTQSEFGELLGVSKDTISRIELGKQKISIDMLEILHNEIDVDINWLIQGQGDLKFRSSPVLSPDNKLAENEKLSERIKLLEEQLEQTKAALKNANKRAFNAEMTVSVLQDQCKILKDLMNK